MDTSSPEAGTLVLAGEHLPFRTSACTAARDRFAATGTGSSGGTPFVVTVRQPDILVVKFGVRRELDRPAEDKDWLHASPDVRLWSDGQVISGEGHLVNMRETTASPVAVSVSIPCPGNGGEPAKPSTS